MPGRVLHRLMLGDMLHGTHKAIPSVGDELDVIGGFRLRRLLCLHAVHHSTAGRLLQPPRLSAILGVATQPRSVAMPDNWPAWKDQTVEQKLDFLHEWLSRVSNAIQSLQGATQGLHERLRAVEAVNAQQPKPQTPPAPQD